MQKSKYTKYYAKATLLLLCLVTLAAATLIRKSSCLFVGKDAYFLLRISEGLALFDSLSYGGRFAAYSFGLPAILSIVPSKLIPFLPIMAGLVTLVLLIDLLQTLRLPKKVQFLALVLIIISPPFIYLFGTLNSYFFPVFLAVLGFYLFTKNERAHNWLFVGVSCILPFFSIKLTCFFFIILFLYYYFREKDKGRMFWAAILLAALLILVQLAYAISGAGEPTRLNFIYAKEGLNSVTQQLISDLGSLFGVGIFAIFLGLAGIFSEWKNKYKNLFVFFSTISLVVITILKVEAIFFLNFFLCVFSAYGIVDMVKNKWESQTMKNFMIIILVCGLIFSAVSQINKLGEAQPSEGIIDGLEFLKKQEPGTVFSHYSRGIWLNYVGKKNVMDENFLFAPQVNERYKDSEKLFETRNEEEAMAIIGKYNIKYVWLDERLKKELWGDEEEGGLLFVLKYSGRWKQIYNKKNVEIWGLSGTE